jgi:hypothetical protein
MHELVMAKATKRHQPMCVESHSIPRSLVVKHPFHCRVPLRKCNNCFLRVMVEDYQIHVICLQCCDTIYIYSNTDKEVDTRAACYFPARVLA